MDIDALRASREDSWERMRELASTRKLTGPQIDELDALYRLATSDLARVRAQSPDPDTIRALSRDLAQARGRLTGTRAKPLALIPRFFRIQLPEALYSIRWWIVGVTAAFFCVAAMQMFWVLWQPDIMAQLGSPEQLRAYATREFVAYYSQDTNAEFGLSVWTNNAWIALGCVGGGITGVYPVYVLLGNATSLGTSAAVVIDQAGPWHFFRMILPHGIPELTAVFIAAAAGLRVFWALIVPGPAARTVALARAGRTMAVVAVGCVILLFISGILEGFVTPSGLPDVIKVSLGTGVTLAMWVYIFVSGRRAHTRGEDADVDPTVAGYVLPVAG
ncbi:stage II sporulation protein M [Schaalia sp. ZJ405]|uniref:stage II sporulation protein M n=1 Tax=Schaalia sp. ZJ405 TaxID=2709403 RepID=UPI0013ECBE59|nr:stage II sporulation protein M [Schaalia sp. ZJ405]QPK81727.1 stage II sporulation protein M [Schaalia sp. ZJ405]